MITPMLFKRTFSQTTRKLDFAKMTIIGRIGNDLASQQGAKGTPFLKYNIAVQPQKDAETNWFNVVCFSEQQIKFMEEYVRKGALVYVEANVRTSNFEKEDGSKSYGVSFIQKNINILQNGKETAE